MRKRMRKRKLPKFVSVLAYIILGIGIGGIGATDTEATTRLQEVESELYDLQSSYDLLVEENESLINELKMYEEQEAKVEKLEEELEEIQVEYTNLIEENESLEEEIQEAQTASTVTRGGMPDLTQEPVYEDVEEDTYEYMVWLSATGEKYHSIPNCGRMNPNKARQISESSAIASGYEACSKCF